MDKPIIDTAKFLNRPWVRRVPLYLLIVFTILTFPLKPTMDLDASWRMALGKFLIDGLQFGRDVVFTYGPLGFLMGKTYYGSGILLKGILVWQFFSAFAFAAIIMMWGERLSGWPKLIFYVFFIIFGVTYDDALQMIIIALMGMELVRRSGQPRNWGTLFMLVLLGLMSVIKFTNFMLAAFVVFVAALHELGSARRRQALTLLLGFGGSYLVIWTACWQNPLNLPTYWYNSFLISKGYEQCMGIATPLAPFWKALVVCALLVIYLLHHLILQRHRLRTFAYSTILVGFLFLNWKHGFVRSDGHMVGFFLCAMVPIVMFPVLLEDSYGWKRFKRTLLVSAGILCILGTRDTLPGMVDYGLGNFQIKLWQNVANTAHLANLREPYDIQLAEQRKRYDLERTREKIGAHSVDVIGHDQAAALFSRLNYVPRPVLQSYSAYTPELANLNARHYEGNSAPDYVLLKIGSIDQRLPIMDDSAALYVIAHRYKYLLAEKGFQLWEKRPGPFDAKAIAPKLLTAAKLPLDTSISLEEYKKHELWATIDLQPSLLGRLRNFLYKPPQIYIELHDIGGNTSTYRMPAPIGRAGFIVSPIIDDIMGYIYYAADKPERMASSIMVHVAPEDRKYYAGSAELKLYSLAPPDGGRTFFNMVNKERFHVFNSAPVSFYAQTTPSDEVIDGQPVIVMHAPSEMTFDLPRNATEITGAHGFIKGAYTNGGNTNGAIFMIVWSDGKSEVELYRRFLDPKHKEEDRGLIDFDVKLKGLSGGRLYFRVLPGPYNDLSWDWAAWTGITIK